MYEFHRDEFIHLQRHLVLVWSSTLVAVTCAARDSHYAWTSPSCCAVYVAARAAAELPAATVATAAADGLAMLTQV